MKLINKFVDLNSQSFRVRIVYEYVVLFDIVCFPRIDLTISNKIQIILLRK